MNNPEKLATFGTQDEDKQNKIQHNMCWTPLCANNINKTRALPQTGGKDEPNIVLCGNSNGHHNMELRTQRQYLDIKVKNRLV
jgi:hypothetical protein